MPDTDHALTYPDSSGVGLIPTHLAELASDTEAALDTYETWTAWSLVWNAGVTTLGASVSEGFYQRIGDLVHAEFRVELGAGFAVSGGTFNLDLPVPAYVWNGSVIQANLGAWLLRDDSVPDHWAGTIGLWSATGLACAFGGAWDGAEPQKRLTSVAGTPITYAAGDILSGVLDYRAA